MITFLGEDTRRVTEYELELLVVTSRDRFRISDFGFRILCWLILNHASNGVTPSPVKSEIRIPKSEIGAVQIGGPALNDYEVSN